MLSTRSTLLNAERGAYLDQISARIREVSRTKNKALKAAQKRIIRARLESFRAFRLAVQGAE